MKRRAIPASTIVSVLTPFILLMKNIKRQASIEKKNAFKGMRKVSALGIIPTPRTRASAAPNPAADDTPSV